MKDIPMFTTPYGAASLILKEIPYRKEAYIRVLGVETVAGVTRYVSVSAPAWAEIVNSLLTFGTVIPLMIVGIVVWKKQKTPNLFLAGFLMFAFSGLGAACLELMFYISMYGEVLMATFFYLYAVQRVKD